VLAQLTALAGPRSQGELTRHMVIGAVHRLVAAHREVRGVLLVVDDAHLADEATVEACEQLARAGGDVLVALAYRSESARRALARVVAGLDRAGRCTTIELGPLGEAEVAALVGSVDPDRRTRIGAMAEGNPFFALELARAAGSPSA
jgi:predicted ATPase